MQEDIIIIGAGPAGLIAAYELTKQGRQVLIVEARDRIGGRAHTIYNDAAVVETGAEFVHGSLPITLGLLKEAGLAYSPTGDTWIQLKSGTTSEVKDADHWARFMNKLKGLREDMTLQDFLEGEFAGNEYAALKDQAIGYAEGYDTADATRVSAKALYEEWSKEEEEQYRIDRGYTALMNYLAEQITARGGRIILSQPVSRIEANHDHVSIVFAGKDVVADKVIIALPLGVLQNEAAVDLHLPPSYKIALSDLGTGDVIKFVFRFTEAFWEREYPGLGFLLSSAPVPTWWTQAPNNDKRLTGWMAGRNARRHAHADESLLRDNALDSLAQIFSLKRSKIDELICEEHIINWSNDSFTYGSYAYTTVGAVEALKVLQQPINDRIFFAGEYMYCGPAMGTVEAAFESGKAAAEKVLTHL